jgi:hypothetical protein
MNFLFDLTFVTLVIALVLAPRALETYLALREQNQSSEIDE